MDRNNCVVPEENDYLVIDHKIWLEGQGYTPEQIEEELYPEPEDDGFADNGEPEVDD